MQITPIIITVSTLLLSATVSAAYNEQDFIMTETIVEHDTAYQALGGQLPPSSTDVIAPNQTAANAQVETVAVNYVEGEMVINITLK